jgi:sugar phosphate permease
MGCLIGGPINIITSAVAVDISEQARIVGRNDLMAVTGIINGSGSIIASLGLAFVGPIQQQFGWRCVWYLLIVCAIIGTLLLSPTIKKELYRTIPSSNHNEIQAPNSTSIFKSKIIELTDTKIGIEPIKT